MTCTRCGKKSPGAPPFCRHCGEKIGPESGVFQTSTVLIATASADHVFRSVDEVPARLRSRLLKTTNGANSATILIADRKGRKEIDKALRKLPAKSQRRLVHAVLSGEVPVNPLAWLTPTIRRWVGIAVATLALAVALTVFLYHYK